MIFVGGPILTMSDAGVVSALAVAGDRIATVGSEEEVLATAGPGTRVIDLEGRTLLPGFVDPHTHILNDAWRIDLDTLGGQQLALENGITTLANLFTTEDFLNEMRGYEAAGELRARISLYLIATDNCGTPQGDWWLAYPPTRLRGELLRIGGIKFFLDGGTCGPWALTQEITEGAGTGEVFLDAEAVAELLTKANASGHQAVIHAVGDRATLTALDGITRTSGPDNPLRHRIDHMTMMTDDIIERFGPSGAVGAVFGWVSVCETFEVTDWFEANYRRHQDLIEANPGSVIAWHGDDPWIGPVSPMQELHSMVTRTEITADGTVCPPYDYLEDRAYDVMTGLEMMTIKAAYALHRDTEVGSLEVGKFADLVVLTADPTAVDPRDIYDIEVVATIVGGQTEVCVVEAVCPADG